MKHPFKILFLGVAVASCLLFNSCDSTPGNYTGANLSIQESIESSLKFVTEHMDDTDYVTKVVFHPVKDKGVNKYSNKMTMYMYSAGSDSIHEWSMGLSSKEGQYSMPEKIQDKQYNLILKANPRKNAVQYKDIDFSHIAEYVNEAGRQVTELGKTTGDPIFFSGVGQYTILLNSDPTKIKHKFIIESRDTAKSSKHLHVFYEYPFEVGADGKVEMKK